MNKKISVCIITKDEENNIKNCIESVLRVADEIIIVDTGSKDKTKDIAKEYKKVKLYETEWNENFSEARNEYLKHAEGHWILQLDADETLDPKSNTKILQLGKPLETVGMRVRVISKHKDKNSTDAYSIRLFTNHNCISYKGAIHEDISQSILNNDGKIYNSEINIIHHGYLNSMQQQTKVLRNRRILQKELKNNPNNLYLRERLANNYLVEGDLHKARTAFKYILKDFPNKIKPFILNGYAKVLIGLNQFKSALNYLQASKNMEQFQESAWYLAYVALSGLRNYNKAAIAVENLHRISKEIENGKHSKINSDIHITKKKINEFKSFIQSKLDYANS